MVTDGGVRKVKILQKSGENFVHFAEVEVYDGSGLNRARGKMTTQSSTLEGITAAFGPQKSVDGNTTTYLHTAGNENGKV
jgi:cyclophilin family peptidyl-prolyl cis-trans isomerase